MPSYKNIAGDRLQVVQRAVKKTGIILASAITKLSSPEKKMTDLLRDAFGILPDRSKDIAVQAAVMTLTTVLNKILTCMARSKIIFEPKPPAAASQFACYVIVNTHLNEVFLTKKFFGDYSMVERAAYLAHEYVHLSHWPNGHPGVSGEQLAVLFARTPLGIPPQQAVNNAYCYQYFVEWFAADYPG